MARWHRQLAPAVGRAKEHTGYWFEKAKLDFALKVNRLLELDGVSKTELAQRIGTSQPYITKTLRGDANLTIETMVKIVFALNAQIVFDVQRRNISGKWEKTVEKRERAAAFRPPSCWFEQRRAHKPANDSDVGMNNDDQAETSIAA
ncbi:helix-turn-helix protein [bacterium BMS3Bbin13]|nr:helix-turn-helix protein [bacterium BMS3Bbin13]